MTTLLSRPPFRLPPALRCVKACKSTCSSAVGFGGRAALGGRAEALAVAEALSQRKAKMATTTWDGAQLSQEDFMQRDTCVLVDEADNVVGSSNKYNCHRFVPGQEQGQLHRAFSVFLFDAQNRLLLQQRAKSKITFPSVWTNTCCSHQLHGQDPPEVDPPTAITDGSVLGAKHAAVRKLQHELGIPAEQLDPGRMKYLTRLHYCARDEGTWGPKAEWGEHEMDYILFMKADVTLAPNPEEVDAVRYVTQEELQKMMEPASGLLWSPWFRIIATRFLPTWWADLDEVLAHGKHQDLATIHHINADTL